MNATMSLRQQPALARRATSAATARPRLVAGLCRRSVLPPVNVASVETATTVVPTSDDRFARNPVRAGPGRRSGSHHLRPTLPGAPPPKAACLVVNAAATTTIKPPLRALRAAAAALEPRGRRHPGAIIRAPCFQDPWPRRPALKPSSLPPAPTLWWCVCARAQDGSYDLTAPPPFTLQDLRNAIPEHCWQKDTARSVGHLVLDVAIVFGLAAAALTINQW